jgi:hypothetical protein
LQCRVRCRHLDLEVPQVGLCKLDELLSSSGQDGPGRIERETLDLATGELGRQRQFLAGGAHLDQGRAIVGERLPQRTLKLFGPVHPRAEQPDGPGDPGEVGVVEVGAEGGNPGGLHFQFHEGKRGVVEDDDLHREPLLAQRDGVPFIRR